MALSKKAKEEFATWCLHGKGNYQIYGHDALTGKIKPYQYQVNCPFDAAYVRPIDKELNWQNGVFNKNVNLKDEVSEPEILLLLNTGVKAWALNGYKESGSDRKTSLAEFHALCTALVDMGYKPSLEALKQIVNLGAARDKNGRQFPEHESLQDLAMAGDYQQIYAIAQLNRHNRGLKGEVNLNEINTTIDQAIISRDAAQQKNSLTNKIRTKMRSVMQKVEKVVMATALLVAVGTAGDKIMDHYRASTTKTNLEPTAIEQTGEFDYDEQELEKELIEVAEYSWPDKDDMSVLENWLHRDDLVISSEQEMAPTQHDLDYRAFEKPRIATPPGINPYEINNDNGLER